MKNIFYIQENGGIYWVHYSSLDGLPFKKPCGSYNVLKARLLNLSYGDFLLLARNNYNATLKGRDGGYIVEFFQNIEDAKQFASLLNGRLNKVIEYYNLGKE